MMQMYIVRHVKHPLFLSEFYETLIFSTYFRKILKYQISWKSAQWEPSCSMWPDGQTERRRDTAELIVVFRNILNAPENC